MNKLKSKIKKILGTHNTAKLKKAFPFLRIIKNIICWTIIAVIVFCVIVFMITRLSGGTPSIFGYSLHRVMSGSMEPELQVNDVLLNKDVTDPSQIQVGDIVAYEGGDDIGNVEVTHRVIVAPHDDGSGRIVFVTKGDTNAADDGEIGIERLRSVVVSKLPFLKWIMNFFFSVWGLIFFLSLLLLIFIDEFKNIVRQTSRNVEEDKEKESFREIMERMKLEESEKAKRKKELNSEENKQDSLEGKS